MRDNLAYLKASPTFDGNVTITGNQVLSGTVLQIPAAAKLYLDGGGDTYLQESTNNTISVVSGGNALFVASGVVSSAFQQRAVVFNSAAQSINDSTVTLVTFDTSVLNVGLWSGGAPTRFTVPTGGDGLYLVQAIVPFASNAAGIRQLVIRKNTADINPFCLQPAAAATTFLTLSHTLILALAAGDFVDCTATQTSGGALNIGDGTTSRSQFQAVKLW